MMTIDNLVARARARLILARRKPSEAAWIVRDIFEAIKGWSLTDTVTKGSLEASDRLIEKVMGAVERIAAGEPLQQVTGMAHFAGLKIHVTPDVLIPRPETEQLVDMIADDAGDRADLRVLDIGTGSGCIALALGRHLRFAEITAIDISDAALEVARDNAIRLKVNITFKHLDILTEPLMGRYDIVVSNPPYIGEAEKQTMTDDVLLHEPHTALFVPDDDPCLFYRAIATKAFTALTPGGGLYFEINPLHAAATRRVVEAAGFTGVEVIRDERGLERFITARKPSTR